MRSILLLLLYLPSLSLAKPEAAVKICRVEFEDNENSVTSSKSSYGSGTVIFSDDEYSIILTNAHVAPYRTVYFVFHDSTVYRASWIAAVDEDNRSKFGDLALLRVEIKLPSAQVALADPEKGVSIKQYSHPGAGRLTTYQGKFLGVDGWSGYGDYAVHPGCSGSGVFLPGGRLFGVCYGSAIKQHGGYKEFIAPCMLVPCEQVRNFLIKEVPKEMGVIHEKGPMPRHIPRGSDPR